MDYSHFVRDFSLLPELVVGVVLTYAVLLVFIKFIGLKSFSQMSSYDYAHSLIVCSLTASVIGTGKPSIVMGIVIIGLLFAVKYVISYLTARLTFFDGMINNRPLLLVHDGVLLKDNLQKARVSRSELMGKLRESNVMRLEQVKAVVLETTGNMSVLHTEEDNFRIDDEILEGVNGLS